MLGTKWSSVALGLQLHADLASWSVDDHEKSLKLHSSGILSKEFGDTLRHNGLKSCIAEILLKKVHVQARLKLASEHVHDSGRA